MRKCYKIKKAKGLISFLEKKLKIDPYLEFSRQLETNHGFVYNLPGGQVIFIPNNFMNDGLIFEDKKCFRKILRQERFPLEEPEPNLYDIEMDRIREIHRQIDFYREYLNKVLRLDFPDVSREAAQAYLKKIIGRTIRKLTTDTDLVALVAVFGEIIRREIKGKWVIEKWYGMYNPHYKPRVMTKNMKLIFIDDIVLLNVKWKVSDVSTIFKVPFVYPLKERLKYHGCTVLE